MRHEQVWPAWAPRRTLPATTALPPSLDLITNRGLAFERKGSYDRAVANYIEAIRRSGWRFESSRAASRLLPSRLSLQKADAFRDHSISETPTNHHQFVLKSEIQQLRLFCLQMPEKIFRDLRVTQLIRVQRRPVFPLVNDGAFRGA
jgi:hypothetical protein